MNINYLKKALIIIFSGSIVTGCVSNATSEDNSSYDRIYEDKEIKIAVDNGYFPFGNTYNEADYDSLFNNFKSKANEAGWTSDKIDDYSYLKASIGSSFAALHAGHKPKITPTSTEKVKASMIEPIEI